MQHGNYYIQKFKNPEQDLWARIGFPKPKNIIQKETVDGAFTNHRRHGFRFMWISCEDHGLEVNYSAKIQRFEIKE